MPSASPTEWIASLERFGMEPGLERMEAMLAELGNPQRTFRAVHVVGTNGKSTCTLTVEALLRREGLRTAAYLSPHVTGWAERIRIGGEEADFEEAVAHVRPVAERHGATQFEALTLAALAAFASAGVEAAAVEAGLGGRLDATNVLAAPVVVLTNVGLDHTEHLGTTREAIAREKLAVVRPGAAVALGEPEWEAEARRSGAGEVVVAPYEELPALAASLLVGSPVAAGPLVRPPGRLERVGPREIRDGAHNPDGVAWLARQLPPARYVVVAAVLADKDVAGVLEGLARIGDTLVATGTSSARSTPAADLARLGERYFRHVHAAADPRDALRHGHALAGADGVVLVAGSLTLLADLTTDRPDDYDAGAR